MTPSHASKTQSFATSFATNRFPLCRHSRLWLLQHSHRTVTPSSAPAVSCPCINYYHHNLLFHDLLASFHFTTNLVEYLWKDGRSEEVSARIKVAAVQGAAAEAKRKIKYVTRFLLLPSTTDTKSRWLVGRLVSWAAKQAKPRQSTPSQIYK